MIPQTKSAGSAPRCPFLRASMMRAQIAQPPEADVPRDEVISVVTGTPDNPAAALEDLHEKYGSSFAVKTGQGRVWFNNSPDTMRRLLLKTASREADFGKSKLQTHGLAQSLGTENVLLADGASWSASREALSPLFSSKAVKTEANLSTLLDTVDRHLDRLEFQSGPTDLAPAMRTLTLAVGLEYMFGARPGEEELESLVSAYDVVNSEVGREWLLPASVTGAENVDGRTARAQAVIDDFAWKLVKQKRADGRKNAIDHLRETVDPQTGELFSEARLQSEGKNLMLAGHETTASLLTWCLSELARDPDRQNQLVKEIQTKIGSERPTLDQLSELDALTAFWREEAQENPPNFLIAREALRDTHIGSKEDPVKVAAGETVIVSTEDANENAKGMFSFGGGRRFCLGFHLASLETEAVLTRFLQRFEIEDHGPEGRVSSLVQGPADTEASLTLRRSV